MLLFCYYVSLITTVLLYLQNLQLEADHFQGWQFSEIYGAVDIGIQCDPVAIMLVNETSWIAC